MATRVTFMLRSKKVSCRRQKWSQQALDTYKTWMNVGFAPGS